MNMKMILEEELRPAINVYHDERVLVHTTKTDKDGRVLCETLNEGGYCYYTHPTSLRFLDSEEKFNQFAWDY